MEKEEEQWRERERKRRQEQVELYDGGNRKRAISHARGRK